ncbi:hypothetical protein [uncultured Methanocorpusculum sp.]|nr:hypothetical protein [uncultured Methanocorpusculum sp.]
MITVDSASVRDALETAFPLPDDPFARAWHLQKTEAALEKLAKDYGGESKEIAAELYASGLTSPDFEVDVPVKMQATVDISKLKDELPQLASGLLYVNGSNAVKLIGERRLYELAIEIAGESRVALVEQIRVEELRRALLAEEQGRFISDEEKQTGVLMVVPRRMKARAEDGEKIL